MKEEYQKEAAPRAHAGMAKIPEIEEQAHGRSRRLDDENELRFGVTEDWMYARMRRPVAGAQWTGVVTSIAIAMLESGKVDAVVCVQSDEADRYGRPRPR